jgi:predicted RND superfamily exporter protein
MRNSFVRAAGLAALAVLLVLIWDLEHPREVILASLPTVLGLVQLFGLLGHLGIAINPANIIVLPLILGIGVDDAVHVVHNWLLGRKRGESAAHYPDRGTVTGIVLTSLTTLIGFGSLTIAQHQGLFTLGLVACLGVLACLLNSLLVLPCLLEGLRLLGLLPAPQTGDSPSGITSGEPVYEQET